MNQPPFTGAPNADPHIRYDWRIWDVQGFFPVPMVMIIIGIKLPRPLSINAITTYGVSERKRPREQSAFGPRKEDHQKLWLVFSGGVYTPKV